MLYIELILFNFDRSIYHKYQPSLTNCLPFFCLLSQKMQCLCYEISIAEVSLCFNLDENPIPELH